ncbi:MAG: hypothetical protein SGJ11_09470 [Phycisphaerae bacterium]|nr:hypothetical protein [Phycisphaerae bacterium]
MASHAGAGTIVGGVNAAHTFASGKTKSLDLAIGTPADAIIVPLASSSIVMGKISQLRVAMEAKQCMTEHSKTKPRIYDELSSSHEIVHKGEPKAIACGIVVVNIAEKYASPTRRLPAGPVLFTSHKQPEAAGAIVQHLRGLHRRTADGQTGFDAFVTIVIDCDNTAGCLLHTGNPAPQPGDLDHYDAFIHEISRAYVDRFSG